MDTNMPGGPIGLLPFWILIAGALVVAATAWLDPEVRHADSRRGDDD